MPLKLRLTTAGMGFSICGHELLKHDSVGGRSKKRSLCLDSPTVERQIPNMLEGNEPKIARSGN